MNTVNTLILTVTVLLTFTLVATGAPTSASAQYLGNDGAGKVDASTLEEVLKIKSDQVRLVESIKYPTWNPYPHHPQLGTFVIVGAAVGSVAAVFFIKGRSGRYAAMGNG